MPSDFKLKFVLSWDIPLPQDCEICAVTECLLTFKLWFCCYYFRTFSNLRTSLCCRAFPELQTEICVVSEHPLTLRLGHSCCFGMSSDFETVKFVLFHFQDVLWLWNLCCFTFRMSPDLQIVKFVLFHFQDVPWPSDCDICVVSLSGCPLTFRLWHLCCFGTSTILKIVTFVLFHFQDVPGLQTEIHVV